MRRCILALVLAVGLLAPGIAWRVEALQERPWAPRARPGDGDVRPARPGLPPSGRPSDPHPGLGAAPVGVCSPVFERDVTPLFVNEPVGIWEAISADCGATPGCNDYFDFVCGGGGVFRATFCSHGGGADFDTNLSVWEGSAGAVCEDEGCGGRADLAWPVPGYGGYRLRVGGTGGASGAYALAVNMPSNCFLGIIFPVELQEFSVE